MSTTAAKPRFTYLLAFLAGVAGALVGFIVVGLLADFVLGLRGMSDREGYRAMVSFFTFAPAGGLAGLFAGSMLVFRYRAGFGGFAGLTGRAALIFLVLAAVTALGLFVYSQSGDVLVTNGPPPQLSFQIRLPQGATVPSGTEIELDTDKNTMPATFTAAEDDERTVLSGQVDLYFRTSRRILVLRAPGEPDRLFILDLAANPSATPEFGPWNQVDEIADGANGALRKAIEADAYEIRYRVKRID